MSGVPVASTAVEYTIVIEPARRGEFEDVMAESRSWRLRSGAVSWGLFEDVQTPGRFVEYFAWIAMPLFLASIPRRQMRIVAPAAVVAAVLIGWFPPVAKPRDRDDRSTTGRARNDRAPRTA